MNWVFLSIWTVLFLFVTLFTIPKRINEGDGFMAGVGILLAIVSFAQIVVFATKLGKEMRL